MTDDQVKRLPTWAQQEIHRLRMALESAQRKNRIFSGEEKSRLGIKSHGIGDIQYLPEGYHIVAFPERNGGIDIRLTDEDGVLYVSGVWNNLFIRPRGSNAISVCLETP